MINIKDCNQKETRRQIEYLEQTPVRKSASMLRNGNLKLKKATITSLKELGALSTIFSDIEPAKVPAGQETFLVKDMKHALEGYDHTNSDTLKTIEIISDYRILDKKESLELNITIFHKNGNYMIIDGNKRTIAFYQNHIDTNKDEIHFPVYLLEMNFCASEGSLETDSK